MPGKEPSIPEDRTETIRQAIISMLLDGTFSAKDLSAEVRISEKDISSHLEHIQRTINHKELMLIVVPAECKKCGYVFKKRQRLKKPGKCPLCRSELIQEPLFSIQKKQ